MKHWESGRSCSWHQSFLALESATSLTLHWAQMPSGTPCSSHHQPPALWPLSSATFLVDGALVVDVPQPAEARAAATMRLRVVFEDMQFLSYHEVIETSCSDSVSLGNRGSAGASPSRIGDLNNT